VVSNALLINFKASYFHFYPASDEKSVLVKSDMLINAAIM